MLLQTRPEPREKQSLSFFLHLHSPPSLAPSPNRLVPFKRHYCQEAFLDVLPISLHTLTKVWGPSSFDSFMRYSLNIYFVPGLAQGTYWRYSGEQRNTGPALQEVTVPSCLSVIAGNPFYVP